MSKKNKKPNANLPNWKADAPLEPLTTALGKVDKHIERFILERCTDKPDFEGWASSAIVNLDAETYGNRLHLHEATRNADAAEMLVRGIAEEIEKSGGKLQLRANAAGVNALAAAQMVNSALVTHMRALRWYANSTLILLRTSIDLAARAAFIARGTGSEATRWEEGPRLKDGKQRKAARFLASDCIAALSTVVRAKRPGTDDPRLVYEWLCAFTHLDAVALEDMKPSHEDAYATIAYVAWVAAVVAEVVAGYEISRWPSVWPPMLPWNRSYDS
jgi:hypothetical protein